MEDNKSCISENLDIISVETQYCQCEKMNNPDEIVVELARSAGALFQYNKQKNKFLLHSRGRVHEFDADLCFWCNYKINL
jgi:hypothetical protein